MAATLTLEVPHLGGIKAGYAISSGELDASKPTCVLINALHTTVALWRWQFESRELTAALNLVAIEPLGHGATTCPVEQFTYWDTAIMALQVMDKLGVGKAFAAGTSQGGFIVTRMALLAPERVSTSSPKRHCMKVRTCSPQYLLDSDPRNRPDRHVDGPRVRRLPQQGFLERLRALRAVFRAVVQRDAYL